MEKQQQQQRQQVEQELFYPELLGLNTVPVNKFAEGEKVILRNSKELAIKINAMKHRQNQLGIDIVTDFDQTISAFYNDESKPISASFAIFRGSKAVPEAFTLKANEMFSYYHKFECSEDHSLEEKKDKMAAWLRESMKLITENNINSELLKTILNDNVLAFRHGFDTFFRYAFQNNLNFLVVSGGISDVIYYLLSQLEHINNYSAFNLLSNKIIFDKNGNAIGSGELEIHAHNKETIINRQAYPLLSQDCILLGDMPHDSLMTENAEYQNQIKIGFAKNEKDVDEFLKSFDIVCLNQGSFVVPEYLLRMILRPDDILPAELEEKMNTISKELVNILKESKQGNTLINRSEVSAHKVEVQ